MNVLNIPDYSASDMPSRDFKPIHPPPGSPFLFHTSGTSAGLPKPIHQTNAAVSALPSFTEPDQPAAFSTTPLYHGGIADCLRAWASGAMAWFFPEGVAPITAGNITKAVTFARYTTKVFYFSCVPYILQMLADEDEGLELLRSMSLVGFGGAALPPSVGDSLIEKGVNLLSRFGSAECGFLMSSHRDYSSDKEWRYLRTGAGPALLDFESRENGLAELVVKPAWPLRSKTNRADGSFSTSDLFEPHPSLPGAWRYHSRADGLIALANGKKFDPAPTEGAIVASTDLLQDALIFGYGHDYPGVLLFPRSRQQTESEVIQGIWPSLEAINKDSQGHARISRNMVIVVTSGNGKTPLEKSSKGTILRQQAEEKYATVIEGAYSSGLSSCVATAEAAAGDLGSKVKACCAQVLGRRIDPAKDVYQQGVDSLSCVQIRKMLESAGLAGEKPLPLNVVYDQGTIDGLVRYLQQEAIGAENRAEDESVQQHQAMQSMVSKFARVEKLPWTILNKHKRVVVLTGATGFLGAHVLDLLRDDAETNTIVCLVRAEIPAAAHERVAHGLRGRSLPGLDAFDAKTSRGSRVCCLPCDISARHLGLSDEVYGWVTERASIVVHAAWTVNFTLRLSSFEDQIQGTMNLIDMAAAAGARFALVSSTAAVTSSRSSPIPETIPEDPGDASPLGYSQSKWVAEHVLAAAAAAATRARAEGADGAGPSRSLILRVGQLCSNRQGVWNASEAYPLMLSTAAVAGCLPNLPRTLDWLPVEIAARAVVEAITAEEQREEMPVYHVVNTNRAPTWKQMLGWIRASGEGPDFEVVSTEQWVTRLETALADHRDHPAQALLGMWKEMSGPAEDAPVFSVARTKAAVLAMREVPPLDRERVLKMWQWVQCIFRSVGLSDSRVGQLT